MSDIDPSTRVAQDITAITRLHRDLLTQAVHKANDRLMPGGLAMVDLAPVSSHEEWAENLAAAEFRHYAACTRSDHGRCRYAELDEDDDEPTLQTLRYWTERWRDYDVEREPTVLTELVFIRASLHWAWDNEPEWPAFARDLAQARARLEGILYAGTRAERGVPCMYDECRGIRLVRKMVPTRDEDGNKVWKETDWHCPRCKRSWDEARYAAMVTAAHEATKYELVDGELWCSVDYAARQVGRSPKTVQTWMIRNLIPSACLMSGRRTKFVHLDSVRVRADQTTTRKRAG